VIDVAGKRFTLLLGDAMNDPADAVRRRLLGAVAAIAASIAAAPLRAGPRPIVVLTSYPDEVVSRFKKAFEETHPGSPLEIVWRKSGDVLAYLRQPRQGGVDVYWSASPRTYATLAKEGALRRLDVDRTGLPDRLGNTALADPQGYYLATEVAGYGFAVSPEALARQHLPKPVDWSDLAQARFAGQIALPSPAKVGYAPPIVELVLQSYGWDKGWALWSQICGNAVIFDHGANFVTEAVASGQYAVGVTIDFFAATAIANGGALEFVYPPHNGVNPGHIAITAGAPNPAGAKAFVEFMLSTPGQKIFAQSEIRKLPVRPAVYRELPSGQFDPFTQAAKGDFAYDADAARPRMGVTTAIFEQFLGAPHDELAALWARIHRAEAAGKPVAAARRLLSRPPISESDAASTTLQQIFQNRGDSTDGASARYESTWRSDGERSRLEATRMLDQGGP
jgi:ABC-type Fe3+ transport system substrate-binding protein